MPPYHYYIRQKIRPDLIDKKHDAHLGRERRHEQQRARQRHGLGRQQGIGLRGDSRGEVDAARVLGHGEGCSGQEHLPRAHELENLGRGALGY